jgi:hypothetical protein
MGERVPLYASAYAGYRAREEVRRQTYGDDLGEAGFRLLRREDLTENMATIAGRWDDARQGLRDQLVIDEGESTCEGVQRFLRTCRLLAEERRLSRHAYLAER